MLVRTTSYTDLHWLDAVVCVVLLAVGIWAGIAIDRETNHKYVAEYQAVKYTIEASLENQDLTDLTRMELLKEATQHNAKLAGKQYAAQQWYGFTITDDVMLLEPIMLDKKVDDRS